MDPVKAMGKLGLLGNALNRIDDGVEVLDDLNDHWAAPSHKKERSIVIEDLQDLAADKSVRVTILSGHVHMAAVGQFYANPKLELPKHKDFRYIPNIISSAVANAPPPKLLADVLNKRNKVHQFDESTCESMIPLFQVGVDGRPRNNKHLLPHRNWCSIKEWKPGMTPPPTPPLPDVDDYTSPPPPAPARGAGSITRRLSKARKTPPERDQRPPTSGGRIGGLFRRLSRRGSVSSSQPSAPSAPLTRTMSLTRGDFTPRGFFGNRRQGSERPDDGGIDGQWGKSETGIESHHGIPGVQRGVSLRGGSGQPQNDEFTPGDEKYFTAKPAAAMQAARQEPEPPVKPFHRTPTGLTAKQIKKGKTTAYEVDLEGGLDITMNAEVNPRDPAGITVPYRLLVPRLFWDDDVDGQALDAQPPPSGPSGFKRFLSFKKQQRQVEFEPQSMSHSSSIRPSQERVAGGVGDGGSGGVGATNFNMGPGQQHHDHGQALPPQPTRPTTSRGERPQPQFYYQSPPTAQKNQQPYPGYRFERAPPAGREVIDYDDYDSAEDAGYNGPASAYR